MPVIFSLVDIFIIIGISQGILLSFTLWFITDKNRKANLILCLLLLIATIMLIGRFIFFRFLNNWVFQWSLWVDSVIFLFGPLLYMYVRRLLLDEDFNYRLPIYHFIPVCAMIFVSLFSVILYTPDEYYQLFLNGQLKSFFTGLIICGIISNCYYLSQSFHLISNYNRHIKSNLSFQQDHVTYLQFFLSFIALFMAAWVLNFLNFSIFKINISFINYDSIWASISIFIYMVGYFSLRQPELFRLPIVPELKEKKERLSKSEIENLQERMDKLMKQEKLFLHSDLTMQGLADRLQTSTNNISWLLNSVYEVNFYDFINNLRVQEFIHRVEKKEYIQRTILGLSKDVGFKSKSTFYKAFKLSTEETPSNFIKKHQRI